MASGSGRIVGSFVSVSEWLGLQGKLQAKTVSPQKEDAEHERDVEDIIKTESKTLLSKHQGILIYLNSTLLVSVVFFTGIYYARFNALESQVNKLASVEVLSNRIDGLTQEVTRLRNLIDTRWFEGAAEERRRAR